MARNALKLSTMVGENFEICWPQMARNALKFWDFLERKHSHPPSWNTPPHTPLKKDVVQTMLRSPPRIDPASSQHFPPAECGRNLREGGAGTGGKCKLAGDAMRPYY